MTRAARTALAALLGLALAACEGSGDSGGGLEVKREPIAPNCTPLGRAFASGLAVLSPASGRAAVAQSEPPGVWSMALEAESPLPLAFDNIGADSDGDGRDDAAAIAPYRGFPLAPVMGGIAAPRDDLALISTSNYDQVLVYDASAAAPRGVLVETPASFDAGAYPLLPTPGTTALRTGVSTLACIVSRDPVDSAGNPITAACDSTAPSYYTTLTAGKALAAGRLFVATSNLDRGIRFRPGTVLVYEWVEGGGNLRVRPDAATPSLFTEHYNPTGVERLVTPGGRELVLVTTTGVIGTASGPGNVFSDAAVEVIDPTVPRVAAVIPLGRAGPSFDGIALDPGGRVGWLGASSQRQLYAVDLRALDEPALYAGSGPPAILDGLTAGLPDARIFTADQPFVLPDRGDGPPGVLCDGFTHVAVNAAGSEAYATDFCDGTFTRIRLDLSGAPPIPYPRDRFRVAGQDVPFAPNDQIGLLRSPGPLRVRPGEPGVDYQGPDVLVAVGQPEAQLCALRVESP